MTRISARDIVKGPSSSSWDSSAEDVSGTRSGGRIEIVVSERVVCTGMVNMSPRSAAVIIEEGSII